MVDVNNLQTVNRLYGEKRAIQAAQHSFDEGGVILSMTVGPKPEEGPFPPRGGITVATTGIMYPPQMVTTLKQEFAKRLTAIEQELQSLGVTGTEAA